MKDRIAIIGAGIGGLAAALALLRRGHDVQVYERAAELGEVGAGIQVTPNSSRVLIALGLESEILQAGTVSSGKTNYLWNTGQQSPFIRLGDNANQAFGAPYLLFHRADLHRILLDAVLKQKPDAIALGKSFDSMTALADGVDIRFEDGSSCRAGILVGADGIHSRVRQTLFGPDNPEFTGCVAWRGLIPAEQIEGRIDLSGGGMWLGPTAHIVTYPVRKGRLLNFIGMVDRDDWTSESWVEARSHDECLRDFDGWHPNVLHMIRSIKTPYIWALKVRKPLPRWSVDRVTLLGDACHSTLPFLSQGANMAIEDGMVLARSLAQHDADPKTALRVYEAARRERTARITMSSAEQLHRVHNPQLAHPDSAQAYIAREWSSSSVSDRYNWIYSYDATQVTLPAPSEP